MPGAEGHERVRGESTPGLVARAAIVAIIAALAGAGGASTALAASPVAHGWWNRLNDGATAAAAQPPPDVPDDGMYVAGDPTGPQAIAAVAFALGGGERPDRLTLTLAGEGRGLVAACPIAGGQVAPAHNGRWSEAPAYDDGACVPGSQTGGDVTFDVADLAAAPGAVAVAIVPTGPAVRAVFEKPAGDALATTGSPAAHPPPPPAASPAAAPAAVPSPVGPAAADSSGPVPPPAVRPAAEPPPVGVGTRTAAPASPIAMAAPDDAPGWYGTAGSIVGGGLLFALLLFYSLGFGPLGARYDP